MALREVLVEFGIEVDEADAKKAQGTVDSLIKGAKVLAGIFVTTKIAQAYKSVVEEASSAAERANKFNAVFTTAASLVQRQLNGISSATGLAVGELQGFAANIGAIIKPALGSSVAAGKMGASIAGVALDIASFNDVEPTAALVALRSGLIGSAEPLQRFGVDTRVAALEAEALRQGISGSIQSMSEGERIQLRYAAIMRQLGVQGALGDAAKTSDDLANATRGLNSQLKALAEIVGGFFIADAKRTAVRLRDIVKAVNLWLVANDKIIRQRIDDVLQVVNNTIDGLIIGVKFLINGFRALGTIIGPVASGVLLAVGAIALLVAILGAPIVLILALGAAIALMIDDLVVWSRGGESLFGDLLANMREFFNELRESNPLFNAFVEALLGVWDDIIAVWLPAVGTFFEGALDQMKAFGRDIVGLLKIIFGGTIGRVLIDFLGAKAGAVVGEFIGRLIGKLAGKIAGKGLVGKAISSRLGEALFGLVGKGIGGITGALTADQLALGLQGIINAPAAVTAAPGGGSTMINQPSMVVNQQIDATGNAQPEAVGAEVAQQTREVGIAQQRQAMRAFQVRR